MNTDSNAQSIKDAVKDRYSKAAQVALNNQPASCCATEEAPSAASCCGGKPATLDPRAKDFITRDLYSRKEAEGIPLTAHLASLGCGNPTALAELLPGQVVLDLGSGGGIDVLLSAKRVGPTGFVYGLDMTDEMLTLAEKNRAEAGAQNVKFLKGEIEQIPLPDKSVDVIISNCVINLSADKDRALREAARVLRPGGRFAVADIVIDGELPAALKQDLLAWSGCVAGALSIDDYRSKLQAAGFANISITPLRKHTVADAVGSGYAVLGQLAADERAKVDGKLWSAFIRAKKV